MTSIPLVDLAAAHQEIAQEVVEGWQEVLAAAAFIGGPQVAAFEREFAAFTGVQECVGVANGTDAIELPLRALGIGAGDEVVLPANSFIATAEAVCRTGAVPVLVDCADDDTYLMDMDAAAAAVTARTRAFVPVHLYGQVAPVERLNEIAMRTGTWVIEDAAQAHGAVRHGLSAGSLGHAAATSFYPGKNLGAYGDAGAVLTNSTDLAAMTRLIRDHGSPRKYVHEVIGVNSRMDTLQAVVLSAKLRRLAAWNLARRQAAVRYDEALAGLEEVGRPRTLEGNTHVWHLYVIRVPDRDRVLARLHDAGIGAAIHYPTPIHRTAAFAALTGDTPMAGAFPVAERLAPQLLSLPIYPQITAGQQDQVVEVLTKALR
ncbi:MAG TPA: DegT/DnrJ/EryC1/StrS family aminotransferase [Streptosporangiaceae bacterium]|jgi:dTDP-4-amino-4,6-dideoxygalactose transaminase|nr:DegT/DnrJ/EryC1/StrS family aminotransferase [Streptosporangiaceae bacterium]